MSISEMMTVVIGFHMSHHSDVKNYYLGYVSCFYKSDFPKLLSYTRFLEVLTSLIVPMCAYFTSLKGKPAGFEFIDSKHYRCAIVFVCQGIKPLMVSLNEVKAR